MNVTTVAEVGQQPPETLIYLHSLCWSPSHVMLTFSPFFLLLLLAFVIQLKCIVTLRSIPNRQQPLIASKFSLRVEMST